MRRTVKLRDGCDFCYTWEEFPRSWRRRLTLVRVHGRFREQNRCFPVIQGENEKKVITYSNAIFPA